MSWIPEYWLTLLSIPAQIVGFIGMACVVYAYLALEQGWLERDNLMLYYVNFIGAVLLLLSLLVHFNLGSIIIEFFWIGISVLGMRRIKRSKT